MLTATPAGSRQYCTACITYAATSTCDGYCAY